MVVKLCEKWLNISILLFLVHFYQISLFFFAEYNLFMLRNTPMKFHEAALCCCKVMFSVVYLLFIIYLNIT